MSEGLATTRATQIEAYPIGGMSVAQVIQQSNMVLELMRRGMKDGVHFGTIPGCGPKPTLLQPGAQKLMLLFGLADTYDVTREDLPNGHREYQVKCTLVSKNTGVIQGSGMGLCSTLEKKYRYRNAGDYEITDEPIPKDAKERKAEYRKQGFGMKKIDGIWYWVHYKDGLSENPDIADTYNTVLKMASKRALVAACNNTLAISDVFTQDVEDFAQERPTGNQEAQRTTQKRPERLSRLRSLMAEAKGVGIVIADETDPTKGLMGWIYAHFDKEPKDLTDTELAEAETYVRERIEERKAMLFIDQDDQMAEEDIEF